MSDGYIGVDESGKGDYFGPLVIAACYMDPQLALQLEGVQESKKLSDAQATLWASRIKQICPYAIAELMPPRYNESHFRLNNLNHMLAFGHARVIEDLLAKVDANKVISDQFAAPEVLESRLHERGKSVQLVSQVRAEEDIAVACASVLARAVFLERLAELSETFGVELPKGASQKVIEAGWRFVAIHGSNALDEVAKTHFKTTKAVIRPRPKT